MKTYLPYFFKNIGFTLVLIAIILSSIAGANDFCRGYNDASSGVEYSYNNIDEANRSDCQIISDDLVKTLTWVSLTVSFCGFLLYMFSREKIEDEFIQKLRFMSLAQSLLLTWIVASILFLIDGDIKLEGFYILQFQLFVYVLIYNYYKKWKFV